MRVIKEKTLYSLTKLSKYKTAEDSVRAWVLEVRQAKWNNAMDLKSAYGNASIITSKRVVFNIKGNHYRLIVDIEYKLKLVFVVWFGTHKEYDTIDAKEVVMKKTREEKRYDKACERVYQLIHSSKEPIDPESKVGEEIDLLSLYIENYERKNFPIKAPTAVVAIKFRMEQMNLKQKDIAPLFGGKTRVSEVLNEKRPLTFKNIVLLHQYLGIPYESLVNGKKNIELAPDKRNQLLKVPAIKELFLS